MAEEFLHRPKICPSLEQMRGRAVAQPMRAGVGRFWDMGKQSMDDVAHLTDVDAAASATEEERRATTGNRQQRPAPPRPFADRVPGGNPERHHPLLLPLAEHAQQPVVKQDIIDVEPGEFADPHPGRVQQLEHGPVTHMQRIIVICCHRRDIEQGINLVLPQCPRKGVVPARTDEPDRRVDRYRALPLGPAEERAYRRGAPGERGACGARGRLLRQPGTQQDETHLIRRRSAARFGKLSKTREIG